MACCGGARKSQIKAQPVTIQRVKSTTIRPRPNRIITQKQYVIPRAKCPTCGYPTMVVNIGGRERQQCSNVKCGIILKWLTS